MITALKFVHTDSLGSPIAYTNQNKTVVEKNEFEPYGLEINGVAKDGPNYTGHVVDAATGMINMQQRYYDPYVPGFTSGDPMAVDTVTGWNFNRRNYASNNPYKFTDPDGRQPDYRGSHPDNDRLEQIRRMEETKREIEEQKRKAHITTYVRTGKTLLYRGGFIYRWQSSNKVSKRALPEADGAYSSSDVYPTEGPYKDNATAFGPNDMLKTNDVRGRWLHGGGTGLANPLAPEQGWKPTMGCTRMQNEDIQELVDMVREFKTEYPDTRIPYFRVNE